MANVEENFRALVEALYLNSTSGEITWMGFSGAESYVSNVGTNKVAISKSVDNDGDDLITIDVFNQDGNQVDTFNDEFFSRELQPQYVSASNYFSLMSNLYELARRNATGADKVIDDLLSKLKAPKIQSDDNPF